MNATREQKSKRKSRTKIIFDLRDVLSEAEVASFEERAQEAGAPSLTEHFLNVTMRLPKSGGGA
jgi:hypothetical protein